MMATWFQFLNMDPDSGSYQGLTACDAKSSGLGRSMSRSFEVECSGFRGCQEDFIQTHLWIHIYTYIYICICIYIYRYRMALSKWACSRKLVPDSDVASWELRTMTLCALLCLKHRTRTYTEFQQESVGRATRCRNTRLHLVQPTSETLQTDRSGSDGLQQDANSTEYHHHIFWSFFWESLHNTYRESQT